MSLDWNDLKFETVAEEAGVPIDFSQVGNSFVGEFITSEEIRPDGWEEKDYFTQHKFRDAEGVVRVVNGGYKLNVGLEGIEPGAVVRITRTPDVPMGDAGKNDMKDYRVEVASTGKGKSKTPDETPA